MSQPPPPPHQCWKKWPWSVSCGGCGVQFARTLDSARQIDYDSAMTTPFDPYNPTHTAIVLTRDMAHVESLMRLADSIQFSLTQVQASEAEDKALRAAMELRSALKDLHVHLSRSVTDAHKRATEGSAV